MRTDSADYEEITRVINLHGHLVDAGDLSGLADIFTADIVYDLSASGAGEIHGLEALRAAALRLGDKNPVGHHVTNVVVIHKSDTQATVLSKAIGIYANGSAGSVVYRDSFVRTDAGWRIARRVVSVRKQPLGPA